MRLTASITVISLELGLPPSATICFAVLRKTWRGSQLHKSTFQQILLTSLFSTSLVTSGSRYLQTERGTRSITCMIGRNFCISMVCAAVRIVRCMGGSKSGASRLCRGVGSQTIETTSIVKLRKALEQSHGFPALPNSSNLFSIFLRCMCTRGSSLETLAALRNFDMAPRRLRCTSWFTDVTMARQLKQAPMEYRQATYFQ